MKKSLCVIDFWWSWISLLPSMNNVGFCTLQKTNRNINSTVKNLNKKNLFSNSKITKTTWIFIMIWTFNCTDVCLVVKNVLFCRSFISFFFKWIIKFLQSLTFFLECWLFTFVVNVLYKSRLEFLGYCETDRFWDFVEQKDYARRSNGGPPG
jgi:hypothetical protein